MYIITVHHRIESINIGVDEDMMAFLKLMGVDEDMTDTVWTEFWDMHSGRTRKIEWDRVYI